MKNRQVLDIHVVQTVPPSCLNRDDTGSPKTAIYGGVQRARVSSQSWKHAIRLMFRENLNESELGTRTKKIDAMVAEKIEQKSDLTADEAMLLAELVLNAAAVTTKDQEARALFFMSDKQADNLAVLALDAWLVDERTPDKALLGQMKKTYQVALNKGSGIDIALFGRMVADDPSLNTDASAQVAHAISTHRVDNEYDYFTAVDDRAPEDNAGAGMIGTIEFNSATLYRYATVAIHELHKQLACDTDATTRAITEFVRAFITSMPSGKQNTFANRTPADAVLICLRDDQPVNMVGAFEEAIKLRPDDSGYVKPSIKRMAEYIIGTLSSFVDEPVRTWAIGSDFSGLAEPASLASVLASITESIQSAVGATTGSNSENEG